MKPIYGKIVLTNGVFDVLHYGHLLYLQAASRMGHLAVAVTRNRSVNKGPHRPTNDEKHRLALIRELRCVDEAFLVDDPIEAFKLIDPDIFVKGKDYKNSIQKVHRDYCIEHGIQIRFTNTPIFSATKIINDRLRYG